MDALAFRSFTNLYSFISALLKNELLYKRTNSIHLSYIFKINKAVLTTAF